jgi:hypothetical protein
MVQILPPKTSLGNQFGQAVGSGLSSGIQQANQVQFQRGMLQDALKNLENLPKDTTPFQLASKLMQATAGIPGAERYVGQLYPLLLGQLRSDQAFGQNGEGQGQGQGGQFQNQFQGNGQSSYGQTAQSLTPGASQSPGGEAGGILGTIIPQDQIIQQAEEYGKRTGTGVQGATELQQYLSNQNDLAQGQRKAAEQKASDIGIPSEELPAFMQLGQRHKNAKTLDDWVRATDRDYKEYRNLSKSLDSKTYPGVIRGLLGGPSVREGRLKELDATVKRLVNMGFEPQVREKLSSATSGLSPAEIEERIHPFSDETKIELSKLPSQGPLLQSEKNLGKKEEQVKEFIQKNVTNDTSLLALRNRLWQDKGYDWKRISKIMNEALDPQKLTAAQTNELGILETEPPRQSLNYIFRDIGNFLNATKGQK